MTVQQLSLNGNGEVGENVLANVKTILVTGGAGFIGGWFVRHMLRVYGERYTVICFDILDYCASKRNIHPVEHMPNFHFVQGDLCNPRDVKAVFQQFKVDVVVHFAANSHVDLSFVDPISFTQSNVVGTHVLLEAARHCGTLRRFIHVSTDEVYGENEPGQDFAFTEEDRLNPTNPYSASKAAAEMIVNAYLRSFHMPIIITRCNNVFGPYQYPEKLIPKFATLMSHSKRMTLHGNGTTMRGFVFASDVARAFDLIMHRGAVAETYNISSSKQIQVRDVADKILQWFHPGYTGPTEQYLEMVQDRPFNDRMYWTDDSKLRELGWSEQASFDDALAVTLQWYREYGEVFWPKAEAAIEANGLPI
ncbi:dTDP-D-glucose 4,6-dehydratase [Aspergillus heteromorphus CBS 117.55]|uniref:dTDP-D-glucose 4,6-dehydratase n=1 Tax=Aspergillus heteromorphus CBS 117.55 TaxID=1448321 RepID=A0A317WV62_9EURO|nr:dTDP-D-glucose 4,6-dehydratase [Aspergillus heteromorphus CBS 117.55]PWY90246.1 dTDP-D-glucose 4,6-dehydratase [Aspergillus heteromorphus CBS 117.55]